VAALDVLRAMGSGTEAFFADVHEASGADQRLDKAVEKLKADLAQLADPVEAQASARRLVERMALVLQGSLLVRYGHPAVADAFCASRLGGDWGVAFGTLPSGVDTAAILERARTK
jgi:putative acyl-CoA dehydrogenase